MEWEVLFHAEFDPEFETLAEEVQDELLAHLNVLKQLGPQLGRPTVDTVNGSKHSNMKELRFNAADGVWRFAFAFDGRRRAIVLCGGDKSGGSEKKFYQGLIRIADRRFDAHAARIEAQSRTRKKEKSK